MEAPEKIYMPNELLSEEWTKHIEGEDVEYIRIDAFIEKACGYFAPHISDNSGGYDRTRIIEDFKKYMEE